jgi:peptide/nickel transport system substrate-binding protein
MKSAALGGAAEADQQNPAKLALRQAVLTAVDRKALIAATVGQLDPTAQPLDSRVFMPGEAGYTDNVGKYGLGSGDIAKAKQLLTAAGYTYAGTKLVAPGGAAVPPLTMRYTAGNQHRQQEGQIVQADLAKLGVTVDLQTTTSLLDSLNHKAGKDYDLITYGWTPTPYSLSGNASTWLTKTDANQAGSNNYAGFTDSKVDAKFNQAFAETDATKAAADENDADALISHDAVSLPLFQWESVVVHDKTIVGLRDNTTGVSPAYNMQEWGFSAS